MHTTEVKHSFRVVYDENIIADKLRLNRILLNILGNAIKFTRLGGTIRIRVIQKPTATDGFADYEFRIKDNGIGMSPEFQQHIFEAFSREDSSTVSGIQGTGLGMAITKNLVDMMGGKIAVHSEEGKGSEFIVDLRFALSDEAVQHEKIPQLQGLRALVADGDTNTCLNTGRMLREIGMRPEWTISGKEAVIRTQDALDQGDEFSVCIIDWLMPDMNGVETVRRIRALTDAAQAGAPIVAMTANAFAEDKRAALEAGMNGHIAKPIGIPKLMKTLKEILQ